MKEKHTDLSDSKNILKQSQEAGDPEVIDVGFETIPFPAGSQTRSVKLEPLLHNWGINAFGGDDVGEEYRTIKEELTIDVYAFLIGVTDRPGAARDGKPWRFHFDPAVTAGVEYRFPKCMSSVLVFAQAASPTVKESVDNVTRTVPAVATSDQVKRGSSSALVRFFKARLARRKKVISGNLNPAV